MASTTDELAKFSNESLHSYSFTNGTHDKTFVEGRRSIFYRSIDFMKQKIKGWQVPISNVFPYSTPTTPTDNFSIGAYPSPTSSSIANNGTGAIKPKLKRTMTDVPASTSTPLQQVKERGNRPLSVATISTAGNYSSLHSPTRFVPQSQAMITTDQNWGIIMANDVSSLVFGYQGNELTTRTILDLVASPYKEKLEALLHQQIQDGSLDSKDEHVLLCGKVVGFQRYQGTYLTEERLGNKKECPCQALTYQLTALSCWARSSEKKDNVRECHNQLLIAYSPVFYFYLLFVILVPESDKWTTLDDVL